jgi:signal transduction histidine kinase
MRNGWNRLTLRARLLIIGVLGVAVALAIGSLTLYGVLSVVSYRTLDVSARATAADVAALAADDRLPDPIPVTGSQIVQVVDARDRVVTASVNADRLVPLLSAGELRAAVSGSPPQVAGSRVGLSSALRVIAVRAGPSDPRTIVVAQQVQDIVHSEHILKVTLLMTYPILLGVLALIAWRVVGAALRPVEALRSSADRISGSGRWDRLPVPASHDEISALAATLNSMLDRLADSRANQRSFIADAAHELRSPLASMQTQLDVAARLGEDSASGADLRAEVERMSELVEDLLVLARLDADSPPRRTPELVPVEPLVQEVADHYPGVRLTQSSAELDGLAVRCRRDELRRALGNLTDNAVRHAVHAVEIGVRVEGSVVVISVRDDGAGIPVEDRERVFERFTRLDEGRARDAGGTGLGLAIVRELMMRNGGEVRLEDTATGGLEAQLRLNGA